MKAPFVLTRVNNWKRNALLLMIPLVTLTFAVPLSGCRHPFGGTKYIIPQEDTAREQARVAELQYRTASQTIDEKMRREEFDKALKALDTVEKRYPDDKEYTPAAQLLKSQVYYELRDFTSAEAEYRKTVDKYPDIEDVHASALYGLGNSLYEMNRIREGQKYFKQLQEQYSQTKSPVVKQLVQKAISKSRQIGTER